MQDCSAEGTWGNESPHFGYNLPRLGAHGRKLAEQEFFRRMLAWRLENRGLEATKSPPANRGPDPPKSSPESSKNSFKSGKIEPQSLQNRGLEAPKSSPEASKTTFLTMFNLRSLREGLHESFLEAKMANLAPSWRPNRLQNPARKPKKSMLKTARF